VWGQNRKMHDTYVTMWNTEQVDTEWVIVKEIGPGRRAKQGQFGSIKVEDGLTGGEDAHEAV
jgi:hypothetical protein